MHVTLINPPGIKTFSGLSMQSPNPPLGLAYIAAVVRELEHSVDVIDGSGEALDNMTPYAKREDFLLQGLTIQEIARRINADTDVVGVSCMFSSTWPVVRLLISEIRKHVPNALLVLGGEHGTAVPEHSLRTSDFDVVVLGEAEESFTQLLETYARDGATSLDQCPGIGFIRDDQFENTGLSQRVRDVDSLPLPAWDLFPLEEYIDRAQINGINMGRSIPLLATRGCPFKCTFCSNPGMWTQRWIPRNSKLVADEMELYIQKYHVSNFDFQDLTAIIKRSWIVEFCEEIISRKLNITWQLPSGTRSEVFDEEVADLLYRSGCRALSFAPESGSEKILKDVYKEVNIPNMLEAMRIAVRRGLKLSCFIVIGFPTDTPGTLRETMKLIRKMAVIGVHDIAVSKFIPYPGSALFLQLQEAGELELNDEFFASPMDFYSDKARSYSEAVSSRRLYVTMLWMFVVFYGISFSLHPVRTIRALINALLRGREETRYSKWFVDRFITQRRWRRRAELTQNESPPTTAS